MRGQGFPPPTPTLLWAGEEEEEEGGEEGSGEHCPAQTARRSTQPTSALKTRSHGAPGARAPTGTRVEGGIPSASSCPPPRCWGVRAGPAPLPRAGRSSLNVQTSNREEPNTRKVLSLSCTDEINTLVLGGGSPSLFAPHTHTPHPPRGKQDSKTGAELGQGWAEHPSRAIS